MVNLEQHVLGTACATGRGHPSLQKEIGRQSCTLSLELPDNANKTNLETEGNVLAGMVCR